jgi:hypothetical protein
MRARVASTVLLLGLPACGGSTLDPGAGNDPGTGTGTLVLDGTVHASPQLVNARAGAEFDTDITLEVSLNKQTVTTGTITITSATGKVPLTYRNSDRRWTGSAPGYDEVYILDIDSGPDKVSGVRVDGPDIHVFSAPTAGTNVDPMMPLVIEWDRDNQADSATIRAENVDEIAILDSGSYTLAPGSLRPDKTLARQYTLRLARTNRVVPTGTAAGSIFRVTIENELDVITQPQTRPL